LSSNLLVSKLNACLSQGEQWRWETDELLESIKLHFITLWVSFSCFHKCDTSNLVAKTNVYIMRELTAQMVQ
jgi:hypothetical protein